jgi:Mrp family chromosome partitioning ATPase
MVIIDTPPVLAAPDARALAPLIDQMLMIVRFGKTGADMAKASLSKLERSKVNIAGKVMTQTPLKEFRSSNFGVSVLDY